MADKSVGELIAAQSVTPTDLFVLEQNGTAKKLTGQVLENWLVSFADGHGGIQSIAKLSTSGLVDTYRITLADTTTFDFAVTNGRSITGISKTSTSGLVDTYTISYNDGTTSKFTVTNGAKGDKGETGAAGKSAYAAAVEAGYTGTEATFYAALTAMPYHNARHLPDGADPITVKAGNIEASAVETAKIKDKAVTMAKLADHAVSVDYTATLNTTWSGSAAPYTKEQTINGILATDKPLIDIVPSATFADAEKQADAWALIYRAVTAANKITFYAKAKPTVSIPLQIRCIRK